MPPHQRLRVVSVIEGGKDDWRVRMAPDDDSDGRASDSEHPPPKQRATGNTAEGERKKKDRWSQMLIDVTQVSHEALEGICEKSAEEKLEGKGGDMLATPPVSPVAKKVMEPEHDDDDEDDSIPLSHLRDVLTGPMSVTSSARLSSASIPAQSPSSILHHARKSSSMSIPADANFLFTHSRTSSAASSPATGAPISSSIKGSPSFIPPNVQSTAFSDNESGNGSETDAASSARGSRATFDSLQVVGRKGSQRIPTFDSQGRRIGVLDHGKFSTEPSAIEAAPAMEDKGSVAMGKMGSNKASGSISVRGNLLHLNEEGVDVLVMEMVREDCTLWLGHWRSFYLDLPMRTSKIWNLWTLSFNATLSSSRPSIFSTTSSCATTSVLPKTPTPKNSNTMQNGVGPFNSKSSPSSVAGLNSATKISRLIPCFANVSRFS
ncbi:hypothetical protein BC829DRAFT_253563 [Chytridium lagenaria]|nr:hypothetical protein BC829DRAFT_253563 [Chytridium lagenaria]